MIDYTVLKRNTIYLKSFYKVFGILMQVCSSKSDANNKEVQEPLGNKTLKKL